MPLAKTVPGGTLFVKETVDALICVYVVFTTIGNVVIFVGEAVNGTVIDDVIDNVVNEV
jgi:hypothetical protein